jgi:hypothetical protein
MCVDMVPFRSSCFSTLSITIVNKVADRDSPFLSPVTILNSFVSWLPILSFAVVLVMVNTINLISFFGTSYLVRHSIILFLFTESNACRIVNEYIMQLYVVFIAFLKDLSYYENIINRGSIWSEAHLVISQFIFYYF